jgi:hypothetical protein
MVYVAPGVTGKPDDILNPPAPPPPEPPPPPPATIKYSSTARPLGAVKLSVLVKIVVMEFALWALPTSLKESKMFELKDAKIGIFNPTQIKYLLQLQYMNLLPF